MFEKYAYLSRECEIHVRMKLIVLPPMTGDWVSVSGTGDAPGRETQAAGPSLVTLSLSIPCSLVS